MFFSPRHSVNALAREFRESGVFFLRWKKCEKITGLAIVLSGVRVQSESIEQKGDILKFG